MPDTHELAEAICRMIETIAPPVPITLMNHDVNGAAEVIEAVVERCNSADVHLTQINMDPDLAVELCLADGARFERGSRPIVKLEVGLGRQLLFFRD